MLRTLLACLTLYCCAAFAVATSAQTPEISLVARSPQDLQLVLSSLGQRGESLGLAGPVAFLKNYQQHLHSGQPLSAVCVFSTDTPMFAAEFVSIEPTALWAALAEDGLVLDGKTGQLSSPENSLMFFVEQSGNRIRISDNAQYLKRARLPATPSFTASPAESAVIVHVDWRNLQPATRQSISLQALGLMLPQAQSLSDWSLTNLPDAISRATALRIASWFPRAESIDLRFQIDPQQNVRLAADVTNLALTNLRPAQSPFANAPTDSALAQGHWNMPIDLEVRRLIQGWAAMFSGDVRGMFTSEQIEGNQGRDVLQEASRILARHAGEFLSLHHLQAAMACTERDGRPIAAAGLRVANPARLDADLQKLLGALASDGAPLKLMLNKPAAFDTNLHRIEVPLPEQLIQARELLGDVLIIHLATTDHAVLIGLGNGSDQLITQLIAPASESHQTQLLSLSLGSSAIRSDLAGKLGLTPAAITVSPLPQGFRLIADLPNSDQQDTGRLTSTAAE